MAKHKKHKLKPCRFKFDDERVWRGYAHGTVWNGFDNVAVTKRTLNKIIKHFTKIAREYGGDDSCDDLTPMEDGLYSLCDDMRELTPMEDGLYSLGWGFATTIVRNK